ncbi:MAG: molybdate ABC transporter permease subunit [Candidatus Omnitrophica bacterium]|nr:molybdate ABC transporter permease subunit [Candidatus Omnitrophota bacterium]
MTDYTPIFISFKCSFLSAIIVVPWGLFWGWILARKEFRGKMFLQTLLYIPLVLPPVLTGYILLSLLSQDTFLGKMLFDVFSLRFVLDWKGAVVAAAVVSSPFMIQAFKQAVEKVDKRLEFVARTLGADMGRVLWTVTLPLSWQGIVAGFFLVFARSLGEFGATIMLAGNIPGKTQTIPLAIYSKVYLGQEAAIVPLVIAAVVIAYMGLWFSSIFIKEDVR